MPPPEAPPAPGVSVVVVVGGSCVLRYSRPPGPPPPPPWAAPPAWGGGGNWGDPGGRRGPPQIRRHDGDLVLLLRSLGAGTPPEPVAVTSFVGPEPRDLLPAVPPVDVDVEVGSTGGGPGYDLAWPQEWGGPPPFAVELPRGPRGFGFSLRGGRDLNTGVYVRGLREGGPAQRCGRIQALARIRGGGQPPAPAAAPGPRGPPKSVGEGRPHPLRQQLPPGRTLLLPRGTPGPPLTGRRWQSKVPPQFGEGGGGHPPSYAMPPPLPCVPPHFFWGGGCPTEAVAPPFFWGGAQ
ncbi:PDZ domain-containing protein MAGIX isoform X2 [Grus americana]|uniref:PDZ domain-containing protein MAGIX isoform X2 n=1 Tax=Grus americana TaxID=9117 RepID=UPI002407A9A7|nr:PDZ domain-containing protein MAGIX isoform X2 [Grus americana]